MEKEPDLSAEITTSSLEAWRSYNTGNNVALHQGTPAEAVSLLKRAVELDPKFAMAHADLGRTMTASGRPNWQRRASPRLMSYGIGSAIGRTFTSLSTITGRYQKSGAGAADLGIVGPRVPW